MKDNDGNIFDLNHIELNILWLLDDFGTTRPRFLSRFISPADLDPGEGSSSPSLAFRNTGGWPKVMVEKYASHSIYCRIHSRKHLQSLPLHLMRESLPNVRILPQNQKFGLRILNFSISSPTETINKPQKPLKTSQQAINNYVPCCNLREQLKITMKLKAINQILELNGPWLPSCSI
jgi:hypothetical protein